MNGINELLTDVLDDDLPKDLKAFKKIKTPLRIGMRVGWYFEDDKRFWDRDGLDCREYTLYSGVVVPRPDMEIRGAELEAEDCVIVMTSYPVEKEYCESTWFALRRLLDNPELVEVFDEQAVVVEVK